MKRIFIGLVSVLLLSANLLAQQAAKDALTVRNAHAMIYYEERGTVMLFGGADERQVLGDLWEWDGARGHKLAATGPTPRTFPAMVYDRDRRRIVLFGGYRLVDRKSFRLGETWEWDGKIWQQVSTGGPSPRNGAAMIYDTARRRVVLFGGSGASGETWEWDGKNWREIKPALAAGRFNSVMAYDEKHKQIIRFGGWNGQTRVGDTWEFDGAIWQRLNVAGAEARNHAAMVYDSRRKRLVLFGGHDGDNIFGDMWEWDGRSWSRVIFMPPRMRVDNGH